MAAIATPLAASAISIIRLSGPDALSIVDQMCTRNVADQKSHTIQYGFIIDQDQAFIDEVLISVFRAPKSYTCEDVVEINAHGGPYVARQVLQRALSLGARLANPGEFTQRAFLNGRIDLSQAEAVEDMIEASNEGARRQAIDSIRGEIRKLLEPLIEELMNLIANIEVNVDYPEYEDAEQLTAQTLLPRSKGLLEQMDALLACSKKGFALQDGIQTVIIGRPNVGKSSLLNALLHEEKAIVTDIAGTTRDLVEGRLLVGPFALNLVDTAGIRQGADQIEQIGIEKSRQSMEKADLILLVLDGSQPLDSQDYDLLEQTKDKKRIVLINKQDLPEAFSLDSLLLQERDQERIISISAKDGDIAPLERALEELFDADGFVWQPRLSNERQIGLLQQARQDLLNAKEAMELGVEPDLIEMDLLASHDHLKEILGEVHRDDLLDTLFSRFCLGK
ncbi:MAG: tRNA uridine-5-carboxymethylaminomethyl(34) synthesis GTPase MnmE [Allobaculum sp.]|nr:tRNA uridine-5-carboxymethylaminomethyl(34) synthesis GTPase MnmE [Allobaculum sp.]